MKTSLLLCLAALVFSATAKADQTINYPDKDPIFSISFPDDWKVEADESVSASSKDEMVNMELIALDAEALDGAVDVAKDSLKEEFKGIKFDAPEKGELNGLDVVFLNAKATLEDVKMAVNCCIFAPKGADKFFMLFNVIPLEALEKHGEDIGKVLNSIKGK
ncbi:MAG: hypothetical protein U0984_18435 [Prosthecobacter sp.]|nr:hypothetical protein [Prosthecobacter sp.]